MKKFGLTDKKVAKSKEKYGDNSMTEHASESFWDKLKALAVFVDFRDFLIYLCKLGDFVRPEQ